MSEKLTLELIQNAIKGTAAAFRTRTILQPAGGEGSKAFPPTYTGAVYATETRRVKLDDGTMQEIPCVLLDSVQSQANRHEEALQRAIDQGEVQLPIVQVNFSEENLLDAVGTLTSLQVPHRIADAILRDSVDKYGVKFRKTDEGKKLDTVSLQNATALYELCPTALIFGIWDSTGPKGGLGTKFQRAFTSEIVGINAVVGVNTGSRIDPLQIRAAAKVIQLSDGYRLAENEKAKGAVSPSEINHGNIPPAINERTGGVTFDYAEQTAVLSLPALRRLHFPVSAMDNGNEQKRTIDTAGQTVLAALTLYVAALTIESGFDLRSRCLLWPTTSSEWELLDKPGTPPKKLVFSSDEALQVLKEAVHSAEKAGLIWKKQPVELKPSAELVALLKKSQEIAAATVEE